jgi:CDP-diacylglycerol---glycerol-3-phosphate 3-phosphatidyltransferase
LLSVKIGHSLDPAILSLYRIIFGNRVVNPNIFTLWGLAFGIIAGLLIAFDRPILAGASLMVSGCFDLLDGAVARGTGNTTSFGAFLDSVLDRYTDLFVMCGIIIHFMKAGSFFYTVATLIAAIGVALIPYARARAEAASFVCKTGFLERPERLILLLLGLFVGILPYIILILAVLTHVTVLQRILLVKRMSQK